MKKTKILGFLLFLTISSSISCDEDKNETVTPPSEEELITTVKVKLKNGSDLILLEAKDIDGPGPGPTVYTPKVASLAANTAYAGEVEFLNESKNPAGNITEEVIKEGLEHQVFYAKTGTLGTIKYNTLSSPGGVDTSGKPIGIFFDLTTGNAGTGMFKVTLKHKPNKAAPGVEAGDITNAGGTTDVEVNFSCEIK